MKNSILLLVFSLLIFSCNVEEINPSEKGEMVNEEQPLVGYWVSSGFSEEVYILTRAPKLDSDKPGYAFFSNGNLIERAISGFCGTPPVSYADYKGIWSLVEDDNIFIKGTYWGGDKTYKMEIVSVDDTTLKMRYVYE